MPTIYFSPHKQRKKEKLFFDRLMELNPGLNHSTDRYQLPEEYVHYSINKNEILDALNQARLLPNKSKARCISEISKLPENFLVAKFISRITVDFKIKKGKEIYFIEFHEKQHQTLQSNREEYIYTTSFDELPVPRCVQRLVKDVWRWKYLPNYQIIWYDWFEANPNKKVNLFSKVNREFFVPGKFSFKKFLKRKKAYQAI